MNASPWSKPASRHAGKLPVFANGRLEFKHIHIKRYSLPRSGRAETRKLRNERQLKNRSISVRGNSWDSFDV
jgi:hypothetical protein